MNNNSRTLMIAAAAALICLASLAAPCQGATINVPADHATIQAAINAAASGDTIQVAAGTYNEQLVIAKPLTVTGADGAVLDGTGLAPEWTTGVKIRSGNVTFNNIDVTNFTQDGITAYDNIDMPNLHITNCKVSNIQPGYWGFGIYIGYESEGFNYTPPDLTAHLDFSGLLIENNEITNTHSSGLVLQAITGTPGTLVVRDNYIHDITVNSGIWIDCARNLTIEDNVVANNKWGIEFTAIPEAWYTLDGPYSAKDVALTGNTILGNTEEGIILCNAWPSTIAISDNIIEGNLIGLENRLAAPLDASANYWGAADGPAPTGSGDLVVGQVTYASYYTEDTLTNLAELDLWVDDNYTAATPGWGVSRFAKINDGINAAPSGGTVHVAAGTYAEDVALNKRVRIIGAGSDATTGTILRKGPSADTKIGVVQLTASGLSDAEPVLLKDLRIEAVAKAGLSVGRFYEATGTVVEYLKLENVKVIGTNTNPSTEQERGLYVDNTSTLRHLVVTNCSFDNLTYGWYFQKQVSADTSTVENLDVQDSTFSHNNHKGLYAEKLSDATFTRCTFDDNGYDASMLPSYFQPWCAGVDINLKAGTYAGLTFRDCTITDNGIGNSKEGAGITFKARDDGATYGPFPATLDNVLVTGCTITGNERGVRLGEPGKNNATPTDVTIENCLLYDNDQHYTGTDGSDYGDVINACQGDADASANYWGQPTGPAPGQIAGTGTTTWTSYYADEPRTDLRAFAIWVDDDYTAATPGWGITHFDKIQDGVNALETGGTLYVAAGTYAENVSTSQPITIEGAGQTTIVAPASGGVALALAAGTDATHRTILRNIRLQGAATGLTAGSFTTLEGVTSTGNSLYGINLNPGQDLLITDCHFDANATGLKLASTASFSGIAITGSSFDNNTSIGWYSDASGSVEPDLDNVSITGTSFSGNGIKGFYTERLSNATFDGLTVSGNANSNTYDWGAGIDINLKWKAYSSIAIRNSAFSNNGKTSANGVALTIKARDDGATYGANPATLTDVTVENCTFDDNERHLVFGEPGKNNAGPTDVTVERNGFTNATVAAVVNHTGTGLDASANYWGQPTGPAAGQIAGTGTTTFESFYEDAALTNLRYVKVWVDDDYDSSTPDWGVTRFASIQAAIDVTGAGGTVNVAAGTYVEQLEIIRDITLLGAGSASTIVRSPDTLAKSFTTSAVNKPVIYIHDTANPTIRDLCVDGNGKGNANYRFVGVGVSNAGATIDSCEIMNVQDTPFSGAQHGIGIYAYNTNAGNPTTLTVSQCQLHDIQKNCMALVGAGLHVVVENNSCLGIGPTDKIAQNGIQLTSGAQGTVSGNVCSDFYYSGSGWGSGAILLDSPSATVTGNLFEKSNFGVYNSGSPGAITLTGNDIVQNDWAIVTGGTGALDADDNWWGTPDGPTIIPLSGTLYGSGNADYAYDYTGLMTLSSFLPKPVSSNALYLEPTGPSIFVKPTETCVVDLKVANLAQDVSGLQALLGFSSTYFKSGPSDLTVVAGGGVWDELIWNSWNTSGDLDVAVGVDLDIAGGTSADATTAIVTLNPTGTEGTTTVDFRPDADPDPGLTQSTILADTTGNPILPRKFDSVVITIDGTAPVMEDATIAATQTQPHAPAPVDVKNDANHATQGTVEIAVEAEDALAGMDAPPTITLTDGTTVESATHVDEDPDGTFNYTWDVDATTANGTWTATVTATDRAGNETVRQFTIVVNKNQITGVVELEALTAVTRQVTFHASGTGQSKTWTLNLSFTGTQAAYTLVDVPDGTSAISAKAAWNLREKLAVAPDGDGQIADVNFVSDGIADWSDASDHYLRGGDINGSNSINVLDYSLLKLRWFGTDPTADIDGNGAVNVLDYNLMKLNWFKVGDQE